MISPLAFLTFLSCLWGYEICTLLVWQSHAPEEVPEAGLGDNFVGGEDAHAVDFGVGLSLRGEMASDDLVFLEAHSGLQRRKHKSVIRSKFGSSTHVAPHPPNSTAFSGQI
jgi:hypothetical protein